MKRGDAVILGTATVVFLVGCALIGLGLAETGTTRDIGTNVWFYLGLPLLILATAIGVHALAMVHRRTLPPPADGSDGANREIPGALRVVGAPASAGQARVSIVYDTRRTLRH